MGGRKKKGGIRNQSSPSPSCNSQNTTSSEKLNKKEKRILVQSMDTAYLSGEALGIPNEHRLQFAHTEFHLVDLRDGPRNRKPRHILPPLIMYAIPRTLVALDNNLYVFGGQRPDFSESNDFKQLQSDFNQSHQKIYWGASRIHFDPDKSTRDLDKVWGPAPLIPVYYSINCIPFEGKIHSFGGRYIELNVLDPDVGHWKPLCSVPPELDQCCASLYALPDPSNNRIFVHLTDGQLSSPSLYAFSPLGDELWKCIAQNFYHWTDVAALVEDVIYFHYKKFPNVIRAFDVVSTKWLTVNWTSPFDDNVDLSNIQMSFDALLSLGDGILCFATWDHVRPCVDGRFRIKLFFYKFKVKRQGDTISLIPRSCKAYELPDSTQVFNFLPV